VSELCKAHGRFRCFQCADWEAIGAASDARENALQAMHDMVVYTACLGLEDERRYVNMTWEWAD
jgi:hypothetical protein